MSVRRFVLALIGIVAAVATMLTFAPAASAAPSPSTAPAVTAQAPTPARAGGCRVPRCFGAISVNLATGGYGTSYDYGSKRRAVRAAHNRCKNGSAAPAGCRKAVWVRNGCAAVAYRAKNGRLLEVKSGIGRSKAAAIRKAKRNARGPGKERVWTWVCTTRRY